MTPYKHCLCVFSLAFLFVEFLTSPSMAKNIDYTDLLNRPTPSATKHLTYGDRPDQFGELWLPDNGNNHPVIIMIHGGCWQESLPGVKLMSYIAEDLRERGFAVWNIEYRRLGAVEAGYPGTFLDIAQGIDYLRTMSTAYKLNLSHVTILGHSAGGQLGLWAAARNNIKPSSVLYLTNPLPINFVITLAGINDLKAYHASGPTACGGPTTIEQLIDIPNRPHQDAYDDTSPAAMLPLHVRQLIVSGSQDRIVPASFGNAYAQEAETKGDDVSTMNIGDAGHFELIDPTSNAWKQIKQALLEKLKK